MNAAKLAEYGLVPVATCCIADRKLKIDITDPKTVELAECIYAFLIRGIYLTPLNATGCGLTRVANGAGSVCTAC
jgi:hypothetical protein